MTMSNIVDIAAYAETKRKKHTVEGALDELNAAGERDVIDKMHSNLHRQIKRAIFADRKNPILKTKTDLIAAIEKWKRENP